MGIMLFVCGALLFFGVVALLFAIVSIPILLAVALCVAAVRLVVFFALLPFRLIGWVFGLALGRQAP